VNRPAPDVAGDREQRPAAIVRPWWGPTAVLGFRALWQIRVHGGEHVPSSGPVLMASNHLGFLDGPLLVAVAPRMTQCLVKEEMFRGLAGRVLRSAGQIPVNRSGTDRRALQTALRVLAEDGAVGVFPEGTRGRGDVNEMRRGVAWLALQSGAPVLPVACLGTRRTGESISKIPGPRRRLDVVFGEPIRLEPRSGVPHRVALTEATEVVRDSLSAHVTAAVRLTGQTLPEDLGTEPVGESGEERS
jgi:1-acyl-sn-glycerol-3-phosphate acyltransferase